MREINHLRYKKYAHSDFPIVVIHADNPRTKYNETSNKVYQRDFWKITYINSGDGDLVINSTRHQFKPGFVFLARPSDLTTFQLKSESIDLYNILFLKSAIEPWTDELKSDYGFFSVFYTPPGEEDVEASTRERLHLLDSNREIETLIKKMSKEYHGRHPNSLLMLRLNLIELLILLTRRSVNRVKKRRRFSVVSFIRDYLERNYSFGFDYERIAEQIGVTSVYLCRLYRQQTGETIGETLLKIRTRNALRLVKETDKTISEIGFECGFNDLSYFYRAFKKETGVPPGKFRATTRVTNK